MSEARRSRFWLYAPFVVLFVLALAWSGVWFYASQRAEGVLTAWIAREAALGRRYECGERKTGGYPFRIELRCDDLRISVEAGEGPVSLRLPKLLALAQIYQPDLVIVEATGPMSVKQPATGVDYEADWSLLQASARGRPSAPQRLSLVVTGPKLSPAGRQTLLAEAKGVAFHARRQAASDEPVFDLALSLDTLTLSANPAFAGQPITGEATGVLRGLKDLRPKPMHARLREWQSHAGRIEITQARLAQGEVVAIGQGDVGLTSEGFLDGVVNLRVAGLERIAGLIFGRNEGRESRTQANVIAGLNLLARSDIDGKRAIAVPLSFREGRIFFGPVPVGRTGAFF